MAWWQTHKSLPPGLHVDGTWQPVTVMRLLTDVSARGAGTGATERREIFDATLALVAASRDFLVLDYFLFNDQGGPAGELNYAQGLRPIARQLRQALLDKRRADPGMPILLLVDPINSYYGGKLPPEFVELQRAGVQVVTTQLDPLRDPNALYSSFWRLALKWWVGEANQGWLPNLLDEGGPKLSLSQLLRLLNFKANHRKLVITGDGAGSLLGIVGSANPHDASSAHGNVAVMLGGAALLPLLQSELDIARFSGWNGRIGWPAAAPPRAAAPDAQAQAAVVTEGAIRARLLQQLDAAGPGVQIDIAMFYLSDRGVIDSLVGAAARGARVRLILDPNKDAFGFEKNGLPNRPVAMELVRRSQGAIQIRWFLTHGEQFHSKIAVVRGKRLWATLGSANFTRRNLGDYNLEANVLIDAPLDGGFSVTALDWFESLWSNRATTPVNYTGEMARYQDDSRARYWLYRMMEASGLSTF